MRLGTRRLLAVFRVRLLIGAALGALFGMAAGAAVLKPPLLGAALGVVSGAIDGSALMALIGGSETFLPRTRFGKAFERMPLAFTFAVKSLVYSFVILCIVGGRLGPRIVLLMVGGDVGHAFASQLNSKLPITLLSAVAFIATSFFILLRMVVQLIGEQTFRDLALGRYRHARDEERFFLFVDVAGWRPLAESVGPAAMHRFLGRVFAIASDPIDDHGGEIFQYVGDEMVITWTLSEGRPNARPLACYFAIEQALEQSAPEFEREFGSVPRLRAALHAGPVITGEVGGSRRGIVFHGDVMNTTSRLENATRDLQRSFLASDEALSRLERKDGYTTVDLGLQPLRGRVAPVRVYAVALRAGARESPTSQRTST